MTNHFQAQIQLRIHTLIDNTQYTVTITVHDIVYGYAHKKRNFGPRLHNLCYALGNRLLVQTPYKQVGLTAYHTIVHFRVFLNRAKDPNNLELALLNCLRKPKTMVDDVRVWVIVSDRLC